MMRLESFVPTLLKPFYKRHERLLLQMERFAITGGLGFVIDYGLLLTLTELCDIDYLVSATISFVFAVSVVYVFSVLWVFDFKKRRAINLFSASILFIVLAVIGLGINNAVMYAGVEFLAVHYAICKLFATAIVMVFNFVTRKLLLEGQKN